MTYLNSLNPADIKLLKRPTIDGAIETNSTHALTSSNINTIFTSKLKDAPNLYVAKAVSHIDNANNIRTIFWAIGNEYIGTEVHHRDALGSLLTDEKNDLEDLWMKNLDNPESNNVNIDELEALVYELSDPTYETVGNRLSLLRNHSAYTPELLSKSQGFFFVAEKDKNGTVLIREFHVNSSITAAQIARGDVSLDYDEQIRLITAIVAAIDPNLKKIRNVKVRELTKFRAKLDKGCDFVTINDNAAKQVYKINNLDKKLN
ncbi:MAG: hypothetical protein IJF84_10915 [Thermoguttaceae bacterium]|nr:hypothetical protein [Thermoguttaceae bacterium]